MSISDVLQDGVEVASVWAVHQGDDDRHPGQPKWWFRDEQLAKEVANGRGWCGSRAPISRHTAIVLSESEVYLLKKDEPVKLGGPDDDEERRAKALAKLTPSEKVLLGLID